MTLLQLEEVSSDDVLARPLEQTVKCSWCGEIIHLDGQELALAMCRSCYQQMLTEFLRAQQPEEATRYPSER